MWLQILMQLRSLLPHLARLVPLLEKRLQAGGGSGSAAADRTALVEFQRTIEDGVGGVSAAQEALLRQMLAQGKALGRLEDELRLVRQSSETSDARLAAIEVQTAKQSRLLVALTVVVGALLVGGIAVVFWLLPHR